MLLELIDFKSIILYIQPYKQEGIYNMQLTMSRFFLVILTIFIISTPTIAKAETQSNSCGECPQNQCVSHPDIRTEKIALKNSLRQNGIPERLVRLVDHWQPVCLYCITSFRDAQNFAIASWDNEDESSVHYGR